ncbi:DMT family transporter [Aneurinibacillus terranovensis]|uniref:DMT family transporter n=1 Tax=Aneurinibacillus terranovensis TaxID=278991 RepID=UPI000427BC19|nr:EamA family transporter [Aneurinibacillus terranovensis]
MKTFLAVAVTLLFWSSAFAGIKVGLAGYRPGHVVLLRFLSASAVFILYACVKPIRLPDKKDIGKIFGLSLLGITIYHGALTFGEVVVPAGTASLLIATVPAFTAVFSYIFLKEKLTRLGWSGIAFGFAGVTMITLGSGKGFAFATDALLIIVSAVSTSLFFIFQKPLFSRYSALELTAYFTWFGTIPLLIFSPGLIKAVADAPLASTWSCIYIGVFPAAVAYVTWAIALSTAPASLVATGLYINPLLAILVAWVWLGELPHPIAFLGGGIALAGVLLVNFYGKQRVVKPGETQANHTVSTPDCT